MKCRRMIEDENGYGQVVFFGSYGIDSQGNAIKAENYSEDAQALVDALNQQLRVIKNELWWNVSFGQPLFDKVKSKVLFDSHVAKVLNQHKDILNVLVFDSEIINKEYHCRLQIQSKYGPLTLNI